MSRWKLAVSVSSNSLQGTSGMPLLVQHPRDQQQAGRTAGDYKQEAPPWGRPQTTPHSLAKWWESPDGRIFATLLFFTSLDLLQGSDLKPGNPQQALPWQSPSSRLGQVVKPPTHPQEPWATPPAPQ